MIRTLHILPDLVYKTAHLHPFASRYDVLPCHYDYERLLFLQNEHKCKMSFRFINPVDEDEKPFWRNNAWHYCLADSEQGDYYWFNLNQLIICTD